MKVRLEDMVFAYRKAKVDLYYSPCASLGAIVDYEKDLHANLNALLKKVNGKNTSWTDDPEFLGSWTLHAKSITPTFKDNISPPVFSSPDEKWLYLNKQPSDENHRHTTEFRVMSHASIDFHVLSSLWIMRVGSLYDSALSECSYGNRLRRKKNGEFNPLSLGCFAPYIKPYSKWRNNAIDKILHYLEDGRKIIVLTADVSSFFHKLNPNFMLDDKFNELVDISLNESDEKIHTIFINSLIQWSKLTPLRKGLPVGLPASSIVANLSLIELDRIMEQEICPLYYGRYVDDILLVIDNNKNFKSSKELWSWISGRSKGCFSWNDKINSEGIKFQPNYLEDSDIIFDNGKNKIFFLDGETGKTMALCLKKQINERTSEWRSLPNLPYTKESVATDLEPVFTIV